MSWRWGKNKFHTKKYNIILTRKGNDIGIYKKQRPEIGDLPSKKPKSLLYKASYSSGNGTVLLKGIFGEKAFSNPKPLDLIKNLIDLGSKKASIVLDFMAGSSTTEHTVLELNKEDEGSRQFILCTNNELNGVGSELMNQNPTKDKEQFGICQRVTYSRIAKAIKGYSKMAMVNLLKA